MTLVTEQVYRRLTGDLRTPVSDVTAALAVAQGLVEVRLGRALSLGDYTESLRVYPSTTVYPAVTPLDPTQEGYINAVTLQIDGADSDIWHPQPRATVTYTGGYEATTLPQPLAAAISLVAKHLLSPASSVDMAGVKSYSEGDISATFDAPIDSTWPAGVWALIRRYSRREPANA